jgi:hypothetical protein
MFLINSRSHLVTAAPSSVNRRRRTFSRSYGTILPSSFTRVLSSALGFSPCPPVSVSSTVTYYLKLRGFSWKQGINHFAQKSARHHASGLCSRICLRTLPKRLNRQPTAGWPSLLRPPIAVISGAGILTCFPSTTHFCLALGAD